MKLKPEMIREYIIIMRNSLLRRETNNPGRVVGTFLIDQS